MTELAAQCRGCKVAKDMAYLRSCCLKCQSEGCVGRFDSEDAVSIDRRNADGFAVTLRQIKQKDDLDEYEFSIIFLLQAGFNLSTIAKMWGCTRANVAVKFKKLRKRHPHYRFLVDWTPHGGRQPIDDDAVDGMIEEGLMTQDELPL